VTDYRANLLKRLRSEPQLWEVQDLLEDAADEIERLRGLINDLYYADRALEPLRQNPDGTTPVLLDDWWDAIAALLAAATPQEADR
jgi:signal transduction histidine kinase